VALRNKNSLVNRSRDYTMQDLDKMTSTFNSAVNRSNSKSKRNISESAVKSTKINNGLGRKNSK